MARRRPKQPPGPNWTCRVVKEAGRNRTYWISPIRRIRFKRKKYAVMFEELRQRHDEDHEVIAWNEYRKITSGKDRAQVIRPQQYDDEPRYDTTSRPKKKDPPSGGRVGRPNVVTESAGQCRCYWRSPVRDIEFRKYKSACTFEGIREQFGGDETRAWAEYRKITAGEDTFVISPFQSKTNEGKIDGLATESSSNDDGLPPSMKHGGLEERKKEDRGPRVTSSPLALDALNDGYDDNVGGGLVGRLPPKSVARVASMTQPLPAATNNNDIETSHLSSDDEEINAWIWKSCRMRKASTTNTTTVSRAGDIDSS